MTGEKRLRGGQIRHHDFDLLLHLFDLVRDPARRYTQEEIAAFCGCSRGMIYLIEKSAMEKLRRAATAI